MRSAILAARPSGGGPAPYHADAVHFDGSTYLSIASLTATDNSTFSIAGWALVNPASLVNYWIILANDTQNNDGVVHFTTPEPTLFRFVSPSSTVFFTDEIVLGSWVSFIFSINNATEQAAFYFNDVLMPPHTHFQDVSDPYLYNGLDCFFASDGYGDNGIADFADCRVQIGTSWLDGGGAIPEATRRLFIDADGKPVDPATATATLGAPTILFSGNALAFGTNQGTGGAFTTTGVLTNASTSPSD